MIRQIIRLQDKKKNLFWSADSIVKYFSSSSSFLLWGYIFQLAKTELKQKRPVPHMLSTAASKSQLWNQLGLLYNPPLPHPHPTPPNLCCTLPLFEKHALLFKTLKCGSQHKGNKSLEKYSWVNPFLADKEEQDEKSESATFLSTIWIAVFVSVSQCDVAFILLSQSDIQYYNLGENTSQWGKM